MPRPVVPILPPPSAASRAVEVRRAAAGSARVLGDAQVVGPTSTPWPRSGRSPPAAPRDRCTTPLPITDSLPGRTTPDGSRRQLVGDAVDDQRVAGIVAALEAHHHVGALRQPVDDLALALVAPLGADDDDVRHAGVFAFVAAGVPGVNSRAMTSITRILLPALLAALIAGTPALAQQTGGAPRASRRPR
jgi:hypothetical protein